jgi:hypothetical protein
VGRKKPTRELEHSILVADGCHRGDGATVWMDPARDP